MLANEALIDLLDLCQATKSWPQRAVNEWIKDQKAEKETPS